MTKTTREMIDQLTAEPYERLLMPLRAALRTRHAHLPPIADDWPEEAREAMRSMLHDRLTGEEARVYARLNHLPLEDGEELLVPRGRLFARFWLAMIRAKQQRERMVEPRDDAKHAPFWCGYEVPDDVPEGDMVEAWPPRMTGWCTGSGDGYTTWTALVYASDARDAKQLIRGCYGASGHRIAMRWEPKQKEPGWCPGDRFPSR